MQIELKLPTNHTFDGDPVEYPSPQFTIGDRVKFKNADVDDVFIVVGLQIKWRAWIHDETATRLMSEPSWFYLLTHPRGYMGEPEYCEAEDIYLVAEA